MKAHYHITISATFSGILFLIFKSWGLAIASFISGIFIDLDHIVDYLREHGMPFRIGNFFKVCHNCQFDRIMLLWHGWEWIILCATAAWMTGWDPWITGTFLGLAQHMILDISYSGSRLRSYSLIWKWRHDFNFDLIFPNMLRYKYKCYIHSSRDENNKSRPESNNPQTLL